MDEITVFIHTEIRSTESETKVVRAVSNIFGDVKPIIIQDLKSKVLKVELNGRESLFRFRDLLKLDRIRDTTRKALLKRISGKKIRFFLNKQVAFANRISLSEEVSESPLGPILVEINYEKPESLVNWLAPKKVKSGE
jgi:predicted RNA binding protein with dsRBD fold (UPF0201 family)